MVPGRVTFRRIFEQVAGCPFDFESAFAELRAAWPLAVDPKDKDAFARLTSGRAQLIPDQVSSVIFACDEVLAFASAGDDSPRQELLGLVVWASFLIVEVARFRGLGGFPATWFKYIFGSARHWHPYVEGKLDEDFLEFFWWVSRNLGEFLDEPSERL